MDMPAVKGCAVENCVYNREQTCNVLAITVGNVRHAHCDTFLSAPVKGGDPATHGRVGACKMSDCRHNTQFECQAPGINVGYQQDEVYCLTYSPA